MKRNFFRVLIALALALSVSMVTAVPVSATHTSTTTIDFKDGQSTVTGTTGVILDVTVTNNGASAGDITTVKIDFTASDFTVTGVGTGPSGWSGGIAGDVVTYTYATGIAPGASVVFVPVVTNPAEAGPAAVPAVLTTDAGSQAALAAALNTGWIAYQAASGAGGNDITVTYVDPGQVAQTLSVSVVVKAITVNLATDGSGALTSTAADVDTAINAYEPANTLVTATADSGHETDIVQPLTVPAFTGGTSPEADKVSPVTPTTLTVTGVVPVVITVSPVKGNAGDTMWVEVTGTDFTGTAATNVSTTTLDFGTGITVASTKFISATELDVQITITASGTARDVLATTAAGTGTSGSPFTPNAAGTEQVDVWDAYTPTDAIFNAATLDFQETKGTIGAAITAATGGDILIAHAGTYTEDLDIPTGKDNLELMGAEGAVIKGVIFNGTYQEPNINILSAGVKIHGFTIQGPDPESGKSSSGMIIGAGGVEIYDNAFEVTNSSDTADRSQGLQTWHLVAQPGVDISGLNIHDNTFTSLGTGTRGYEGIYISRDDTSPTSITIADNVFTGDIYRGITTERSETTISGNSIITDLATTDAGQGILVMDLGVESSTQTAVTVTGNTVKGSSSGKGFNWGIGLGKDGQALTNISVTRNTVQMNTVGIRVREDADKVTVKYNDINGNITLGVENTDADQDLDAKYNWFGAIGGPGGEGLGGGDDVGTKVLYDPWLTVVQATAITDGIAYHGSTTPLEAGWNTLSVPLALNDSADTLDDIIALGDFLVISGANPNYDGGYYYDVANNLWLPLTGTYEFKPGDAVYVKMLVATEFPILYSGVFSVPSLSLSTGWNLVGSAFGIEKTSGDYGIADYNDTDDGIKTVGTALASLGASASVVISPSMPGQTLAWATTIGGTTQNMIVGEGYWVFMTAPATLAGFEITPIYWIK